MRFGARTATAPVLIGLVFLVLGVGFGASGYALLKTIPDAVLGGLMMFSGIELALSSKPQDYRDGELFLVLLMAAIGVALNPAAAFAVGVPIAYGLKRGWVKNSEFRYSDGGFRTREATYLGGNLDLRNSRPCPSRIFGRSSMRRASVISSRCRSGSA